MKIAVAVESVGSHAEVSSQGARARYYLIFDDSGELLETVDNPYFDSERQVAPRVASMLAKLDITTVIAGRFGMKFSNTLVEQGIECLERSGEAAVIVKELLG